jgi:hypothetical protein
MFAPLKSLQILAAVLLLAGGFTLQLTGVAHAANAVQRAADRTSHDRWTRSEPSSGHHSSSDDEDDDGDSDSDSHHSHDHLPPGHSGELNGHVSIHGW